MPAPSQRSHLDTHHYLAPGKPLHHQAPGTLTLMTFHHQHAHTQRTHRAGLEGREPNSLKSRAEPTPKEARNNPTNPRPVLSNPGAAKRRREKYN